MSLKAKPKLYLPTQVFPLQQITPLCNQPVLTPFPNQHALVLQYTRPLAASHHSYLRPGPSHQSFSQVIASSSHAFPQAILSPAAKVRLLLILDNSRVRLKPKPKLTPRIQKLLNREARNCTLSFKEAKIVKKYKDSKSVLLITCKTCNKTVKHHGKSRSFLSALRSNPATPARKLGLKTPERKSLGSANLNHRVSGSKGKSPALTFRTPTSGHSTPTCSSKNVNKTKKHFSQLKMLLSQSESKKNSKVDFRNFLSSL
ncbi:UPF0711 protein C18orf21 homolog isoform X1 [Myotis myotis]|uniref:UPF0711 protein C18orf21 homolog isoform X1 n=1 Tax=Myotis myotis TaxID=51298 RepID=UPI00174B69CC|nr:UPF0711 protein C18orf21 homolog isoform X1 [Myotis myotis]